MEVFMISRRKFIPAISGYLVAPLAMMALGSIWGCGGGVPSQTTLDEEGQKRLQEAQENMRKSMAKRQEAGRSETKAKAKKR